MNPVPITVPIIDLFAGPGGLSEGFSRHSAFYDDPLHYDVRLSIEKDEAAVRTLRLRAFFRHFHGRSVPEEYYHYIRSTDPDDRRRLLERLQALPEWRQAQAEVWQTALGDEGDERFFKLHRRIRHRIADAPYWVLLGGPPCQAYSVVGRSRRLGNGRDRRMELPDQELERRRRERSEQFFRDEKHTLYREYLEIVALHQPAVFVMENVKGILTSKVPVREPDGGEGSVFIFDSILRDMSNPWEALRDEHLPAGWEAVADRRREGYQLYSFTTRPDGPTGACSRDDYLIHAERHGVPQERHRVILLGIRNDLDVLPDPLPVRRERVTVSQVIGDLPALRSGRSGRGKSRQRQERFDTADQWIQAVRDSLPKETIAQIEPTAVRKLVRTVRNSLSPELDRGGSFLAYKGLPSRSKSELLRWLRDDRLKGVIQHETRHHMDSDFGRYLFAAAYSEVMGVSPKIRHFPPSLLPHHENVRTASGEPTGSRDFHDRFRVQVATRPATTIMSHIRKDGHYYIHYDPAQCRSLTVREAARLQTFPDNYFFEGTRTQQYEQVGNAVPPYLAVQLANVVAGVLRQVVRDQRRGVRRRASDGGRRRAA
ncbi:DNA cytosine methyltransferase [Microvirga sp. CF3062]|uniref:DNA cytosine methyltransferase n=1 Tax=Microvirga sp. CF3062 TaxID=3110182 RepID=UPI002E762200|nr:DNA cytosine methyltransferase [Microvirga sp. CF3062]MEE1656756.1 DNA cytosine methyltransferase [Microvirga sp. CF3062]